MAILVGAGTAAAELEVGTDTTFEVVPDRQQVQVAVTVDLVNRTPDQVTATGRTRYYYVSFWYPVPVDAVDVSADDGTGTLAVTRTPSPTSDKWVRAEMSLRRNLFFGESARIVLRYALPAGAPRSDDETRVNPAYVAFPAVAYGQAGTFAARVVLPAGFEVETRGTASTTTRADGRVVVELAPGAEQEVAWVTVSAERDAGLARTTVVVADHGTFVIGAWPGDTEWAAFAADVVRRGVPELVRVLGRPWPVTADVAVNETMRPDFHGYGGWFDTVAKEISVTERLDGPLLLHELSHAWFNRNLSMQRWVTEGLAEVYAEVAASGLGIAVPTAPTVTRTDTGARSLTRWDDAGSESETFGYRASRLVWRSVLDEVGVERLSSAVRHAFERTSAYPGEDGPSGRAGAVDAEYLLDLVENVAGSTTAESLWRTWVFDGDEASRLTARAAARAEYEALRRNGDGWTPGPGIRRALDAWRFADATASMADARDALTARDALREATSRTGLTVADPGDEATYERAEGTLVALRASLDDRRAALEEVADAGAAWEAPQDWLDTVGRWGTTGVRDLRAARDALAGGDLDAARASADAVRAEIAAAHDRGTRRVTAAAVAAAVVLAVVVTAVVVLVRRRRPTASGSGEVPLG
jgi:hypothetical protein